MAGILLEGAAPGSEAAAGSTARVKARGTLVLWEVLDRIVTAGFREQDFLDLIDRVERHLGMVFHRFIAGQRIAELRSDLNGRPVPAWDPFLTGHPATWSSPERNRRRRRRPGRRAVPRAAAPGSAGRTRHDCAHGGPDGWTCAAGLLRLPERAAARGRQLARPGPRAAVDEGGGPSGSRGSGSISRTLPMPTGRSTSASRRPGRPSRFAHEADALAEDTRERARRVFAHRGQSIGPAGRSAARVQAWRASTSKAGVRYRIDESHPAVRAVLEQAGELEPQIRAMLRVIEETVPVQRIWLDTTEARETPRTGFAGEPPAEVLAVLDVLYRDMVAQARLSPEVAQEQLLAHGAVSSAIPN